MDTEEEELGVMVHSVRHCVCYGLRDIVCYGLLGLNILPPREGSTPPEPPPGLKELTLDWWKVLLRTRPLGEKQSPGQGFLHRGRGSGHLAGLGPGTW